MADPTPVVRPTSAARPYARAAFEDAHAANTLPLWSDLLQAAAAVAADPAMQRLLGPVSYTHLDVYKRQGLPNWPG